MKKTISIALLLTIIGLQILGCKKEVSTTPKSKQNFENAYNVSSDGRMLIFKTTASYNKLVNNITTEEEENFISFAKTQNYTSLLESRSLAKSLSNNEDYFLSSLLNEDGIVQIGEFLYKIDLEAELVGVLSHANIAEYADLVSMNKKNKNIRRFTTQDDVIYLAESGAESTAKSCGGVGGGTYSCYQRDSDGLKIVVLANGNVWRINPKVEFKAGGIFFKLSSQYEIRAFENEQSKDDGQLLNNLNGIFIVEMYCYGPKGWCKKRPCDNGDEQTVPPGFYYSRTLGASKENFYSGSRNLNGYYFFIQARVKFPDGTVSEKTKLGGRNINSPY